MSNKTVFESIRKDLPDVDDFIQEFADEFLDRVARRTPVRTGRLKAGWDVEVSTDEITVENNVPYAGFVEDGTEFMSGAHMLKTTVSEIDEIAKDIVKRNK